MQGSGYRRPPALVRRRDGQTLQLTPLLYAILQSVDGTRTTEQLAADVSARVGRAVSASDVALLSEKQLLPLGLLRLADGTEPQLKKADPLLRMRFRVAITDPERTRRITAPFARLFTPFIALPVIVAFFVVCWWLLAVEGLAAATHAAFDNPGLLMLVFVVTLLSAGFHEFGHAAATTRGGAAPGSMGAGLYLVWPAFYTDVTDSYRLGRGGRLRTDAGGLYFNAIVAVAIVAIWSITQWDALLLIVASQILLMLQQLAPIVRFDGYHILADLTGVPDLYQRIGPTLLSLLPWRWGRPENRVLKPGARLVITLWVLIVMPLLVGALALMVLALPRIIGSAWAGIVTQYEELAVHWAEGDFGAAVVRGFAILAVVIPVAGIIYILVRLGRQLTEGALKRTEGRPVQRGVAAVVALGLLAGVAWAWWPSGDRYEPVQSYEDGTLTSVIAGLGPHTGLRAGQQQSTVAAWPEGMDLPTRDDPQLSVVLIPRDGADAPSWVFPFDRPDPPEGDDTQALAVSTEDGGVVYDVAFALVWADGGTVDTTNEAYAFASCTGCAAVAISFQVVLIVGDANVIVPQNLSAAVNYHCIECVAFALASQLVITLDGPLSAAALAELDEIWAEIAKFAANIEDVPLSELQARLTEFRERITQVVRSDPAASTPRIAPAPAATPTPTPTPAPTLDPDVPAEPAPEGPTPDAPTPEPTAPSGVPEPSAPPAPEPTPSTPPPTDAATP